MISLGIDLLLIFFFLLNGWAFWLGWFRFRSGQGVNAIRTDGRHAKAFGGLHVWGWFA